MAVAFMMSLFASWATHRGDLLFPLVVLGFVIALAGFVRLALRIQGDLSILAPVVIAAGSISATTGILFVISGEAALGRVLAVVDVSLAIAGFCLEEWFRRR